MPTGNKEVHPSYGHINISKWQGDASFFGSDVKHNGGMTIQISTASLERDLSRDWIFARDTIVEVQLSPLQFAELITTGMNASGSPCTVKFLSGEGHIEAPDFADKNEIYRSEFDERVDNQVELLNGAIAKADECLNGKSVKKGDVKEIKEALEYARSEARSNLKFVKESFGEHISRAVVEAKSSVEVFIESKIRHLGIKSLEDLRIKKLGDKKEG